MEILHRLRHVVDKAGRHTLLNVVADSEWKSIGELNLIRFPSSPTPLIFGYLQKLTTKFRSLVSGSVIRTAGKVAVTL